MFISIFLLPVLGNMVIVKIDKIFAIQRPEDTRGGKAYRP